MSNLQLVSTFNEDTLDDIGLFDVTKCELTSDDLQEALKQINEAEHGERESLLVFHRITEVTLLDEIAV